MIVRSLGADANRHRSPSIVKPRDAVLVRMATHARSVAKRLLNEWHRHNQPIAHDQVPAESGLNVADWENMAASAGS